MAALNGTYYSNSSYYPKFTYTIDYWEIGRSASAVTYRISVAYSRSNTHYGYDIQVNYDIGGARGSRQILAANANSPSGSIIFEITCSTDASGGTVSGRIWTTSNTDGTHWQNGIDTGSRTLNKSTFNTAPSISGSITAAGTTGDGYISEYAREIVLTWPAATDPNGNLSGYRIRVSIDGGGYTELIRTGSRSYTHNVASYQEGTSFRYVIDAYDSYGAWSGNIYSGTIRKNVLYGGSIASISRGITYSDSNQNIVIKFNHGWNSGSTGVSYRVYSDSLTIYNHRTITSLEETVVIWRTGSAPTGPYIKWQDIVNLVSSKGYKGTLHFGLLTSNQYGTNRYSSSNAQVDIRTNPNPSSSCVITEGPASTAYKTSAGTKLSYFIPKSGRVIEVTWTAGSGKMGESIKYDLYVAYGSSGWQLVMSDMPSSKLSYLHAVPEQTSLTTVKYMIRTKTSYGYHSDKVSVAKNIHYYNSPQLTPGTITRESTKVTVAITVKSLSSVQNINTVGKWVARKTGTTTNISSGDLTISQSTQDIVVSGLTDSDTYEIIVTYNDNTGWSSNGSAKIAISANSPMFFINKYGIGVGGYKATKTHCLNLSGDSNFEGYIKAKSLGVGVNPSDTHVINVKGNSNFNGDILGNDIFVRGSGKQIRFHVPNESYAWISTDATAGLYSNQNVYVKGEVFAGPNYKYKVYHPGNKPNLKDLNRTLEPGQEINWNVHGDGAKIYAEQTSNNSTSLCLEVADDGDSDTVKIRNNHYKDGNKDVAVFRRTYVGIYADLAAPKYAFNSGTPSYMTGRSGDGGFDLWTNSSTRFCFDGTNMKLYKVVGGVWTVIAG